MGEYTHITSQTEPVKIGTCETMTGLRFDQLDQITRPAAHSLDPRDPQTQRDLLFRFPFPDEDGADVASFSDLDRGLHLEMAQPHQVTHQRIQFISNGRSRGDWNVMLPCPVTDEGAEAGIRRNGGRVGVEIIHQRLWGHDASTGPWLATVVRCAACGTVYRFPDRQSAEPLCEALLKRVQACTGEADRLFWAEVLFRVENGYVGV